MGTQSKIIYATFDPIPFKDPESEYFNVEQDEKTFALNVNPATISFQISAGSPTAFNRFDERLKFTSNGIYTFKDPITSFEIPKINYVGQDIYFTATLVGPLSGGSLPRKDFRKLSKEFSLFETHPVDRAVSDINDPEDPVFLVTTTNLEPFIIEETDLRCQLAFGSGDYADEVNLQPNSVAKFRTTFGHLSAEYGGGYLRGTINSSVTADKARIFVSYKTDTMEHAITGLSDYFSIYPNNGLFDIRKCGEDNDQAQNYKNLIYQEILNNKPAFFDNFLGQIVGSNKSDVNTLGIQVHAKIEEFVSNIGDIDYANLNSLRSLITELDMTYEKYNQQFPPSLARLIDILSIGLSNQKGCKNQFEMNFDDKGFGGKSTFGKNKGELLPIETTIFETGARSENIIAYEKFSEKYTLVNTNVISASRVEILSSSVDSDAFSYPLSSFNSSWGWNLVLPRGLEGIDIKPYYSFYKFVPGIEGSYLQKFIDYANPLNTYLEPVTSIPWEGNYRTENPPGGLPWLFDGLEGQGITLAGTGSGTVFDFKDRAFTVEIDVDLSYNENPAYLVGKWPTGDGTNDELFIGDTWLLINYSDGLAVQYSEDGKTSAASSTVKVLSAHLPQRQTVVRIEKVGKTTNFFFDDVQVEETLITNQGNAVETLPSTDFPIQVGGDVFEKEGFIPGTPYTYNGAVNSLRILRGVGLSAEEIFNASPSSTTVTPVTSIDQFREKYGIAENVISQNLYSNLGLLSGA